MHSLKNSIAKRVYTWRLRNDRCARVWQGDFWNERDGRRVVACATCPKFDAGAQACSVPFGSPLRKCVTAAQEANLHSLNGKDLLEIGFGKHSIPRLLVTGAGGTWTGIEPMMPRERPAAMGQGGFGHVADIPFPDASFDVVAGIQSIEHWSEPLPDPDLKTGHAAGLEEVWRVLRPGGSIYFCAPIHLHGDEMFIAGDMQRIRALFDPLPWQDLVLETWREDHAPLDRYATPDSDRSTWPEAVTSYPQERLEEIAATRSVYLLTIKARKEVV